MPSGRDDEQRLDTCAARIARRLSRALARFGVVVHPFFVVREGRSNAAIALPGSDFTFGFAGIDDIPELVRVEPGVNAATCAERMQRGLLCYVVKDRSRIVAKMWCDLKEFNFKPNYRRLHESEVYLFGAYTDPSYRGRNLAPLMRLHCYADLRGIGRNAFFSYTDYANTPARRFKEKLGAVNESLRVCITLPSGFSRTLTLRRYTRRD